MKITGFTELITQHDWLRPVGDVNGVSEGHRTDVQVLIISTDTDLEGVSITAGGAIDTSRIFPVIDGLDPRGVTSIYDRMLAYVFKTGHQGAIFATIGAIDHALWDLKAKAAGEPLWRLLGGQTRFVPGYASGLEYGLNNDKVEMLYRRFVAAGFSQAKVKGGRDPERDVDRLELVRDIMGSNSRRPAMMFDANEAWHRSQAKRTIARIQERVDLTWVEEPLRRWDAAGLADLRKSVAPGIASGENLTGLEQYKPLLDADALDVVQFNSAWGITHALRVSAIAHARDLPVSPVGFSSIMAHATTAMPNHLTTEVQDLGQPLGVTIDQEIGDGGIHLGTSPGAGITVDSNLIRQLSRTTGWRTSAGPHVRPARAGLRMTPEDDLFDPDLSALGTRG